MNRPVKQFVTILLMVIILQMTAGCAGQKGQSVSGDAAGETSSSAAVTTVAETKYPDELPDGLDFKGAVSNFLYRAEIADEFFTEATTGDVVNDAVFNSISKVEDRLNVDITLNAMAGHMASARNAYMSHIDNTVLAGDSTYDWVDLMIGNAPRRMTAGIFTNLLNNKYIDMNKPYYLAQMDEMIVAGNLLFISGDASLGYLKDAFVFYFNTDTAKDYHIEDLYKVVDEGRWTLDKVQDICKQVGSDLNGDGKIDGEDRFGFLCHNYNHLTGFLGSTGTHMYKKNADGSYSFIFGSERDAAVCDKLYKTLYATAGSFDCNLSDTTESEVPAFNALTNKFITGDILLITAQVHEAVLYLRDMESAYGVLPYPKYEENQKEYVTLCRSTQNTFCMPKTCSDPDRAGAVLEAVSSEKYVSVLPTYYETAMKTKYSRDEDSARMFDLVRASMSLQFEFVYGQAIGNPALGLFRQCFSEENVIASKVASNKTSLETKLADYIKSIDDMYN